MTHTCFKNPHRLVFIALLSLGLSACDTAPTVVDQRFGNAVKQAQTEQTLHKQVLHCMQGMAATTCPSHARQQQHKNMHEQMKKSHPQQTDTDGVTAQAAVERYQESFKSPPPPGPAFSIGLGSASAR